MRDVTCHFLGKENKTQRAEKETKGNITEETVNAHFNQVQPSYHY